MDESVCRFCLRTTLENFPILDDDLRAVLDIFLLKPVLYISQQQNIVCRECWNNLEVFYHFKRACADIRDGVLPSVAASRSDVNLDLDNIKNKQISPFSKDLTCHFCTKIIGKQCFISPTELKKNASLMFGRHSPGSHSPELNSNNSEEILSCEPCYDSFQGLQNFTTNCFNVEEKIRKYAEVEGVDDNGKIDLKKVQDFTLEPTLQRETECSSAFKMEAMDPELFDIKSEPPELKCEYDEDPQLIIKHEEVDIKSEEDDESEGHNETQIATYRRLLKIQIHKCKECEYETISTASMKRHMVIHRGCVERRKYKCKVCPYEAISWLTISNHKMTHMDPRDVSVYKCEVCEYETKQKMYLKRHMMKHKELSEKKKYTCKECAYETINGTSLWRHSFTHKDPSNVIMYKCDICTYESKFKVYLKRHMLSHKDRLERQIYKCKICSFETISETSLRAHRITHELDTPMHKCDVCTYQSNRRHILKKHMEIHKDRSERRKYKCKDCAYESIQKLSLEQHMVIHKDPSDMVIHKCELCTYEAKHRQYLKRHMLTHKDRSETKKM